MTKGEIITIIENAIQANGTNDITADVLRPVLVSMMEQINDLLGDLNNLDTTAKDDLVSAINEVFNKPSSGGITILTGTADPNITSPSGTSLGDFYNRTFSGSTVEFYIYNGNEWVLLNSGQSEGALTVDQNYTLPNGIGVVRVIGVDNVTITLPNIIDSYMREITLINDRGFGTMSLSQSYHDFEDNTSKSTIPNRKSITIKNQSNGWIRIR